jgi:hypothetical protein
MNAPEKAMNAQKWRMDGNADLYGQSCRVLQD